MKILKIYSQYIILLFLFLLPTYYILNYFKVPEKVGFFSFINVFKSDIPIYLIYGVVSFYFVFLTKIYKQYLYTVCVLLLINFLFISEITAYTGLRRLYFMLIAIPLLWIYFDYFSFKEKNYYKKITNIFIYISLLCMIVPGVYLPPFYHGIAGWTVQIDKTSDVTITGFYLVRADGKEIRYSRALLNPINFEHRFFDGGNKQGPEVVDKFFVFYQRIMKNDGRY